MRIAPELTPGEVTVPPVRVTTLPDTEATERPVGRPVPVTVMPGTIPAAVAMVIVPVPVRDGLEVKSCPLGPTDDKVAKEPRE